MIASSLAPIRRGGVGVEGRVDRDEIAGGQRLVEVVDDRDAEALGLDRIEERVEGHDLHAEALATDLGDGAADEPETDDGERLSR